MSNRKDFDNMDNENIGKSERFQKYSDSFFDNLIWLTSEEAAFYIRKSVGALRTMVSRGESNVKNGDDDCIFEKTTLIGCLRILQKL